MNDGRKNRVQTERPKPRRVYVSLVNPDDSTDRSHFTAYEMTVEELSQLITGHRRPSTNRRAEHVAA